MDDQVNAQAYARSVTGSLPADFQRNDSVALHSLQSGTAFSAYRRGRIELEFLLLNPIGGSDATVDMFDGYVAEAKEMGREQFRRSFPTGIGQSLIAPVLISDTDFPAPVVRRTMKYWSPFGRMYVYPVLVETGNRVTVYSKEGAYEMGCRRIRRRLTQPVTDPLVIRRL